MNKNIYRVGEFIFGLEKEGLKNTGLLILRLAAGVFMLTHGWAKISNFDTLSLTFADPLGVGSGISLSLIIAAEFGCSLLLIAGLFTRLATLPLMFGMLIAAFVIHGADPFSVKELSVLYLCLYITLFFTGGGKFSLDYLILNRWNRKNPYLDK